MGNSDYKNLKLTDINAIENNYRGDLRLHGQSL